MTDLRQAAQAALEALKRYQVKRQDFDRFADEIAALRAALAQPEDAEPVAWAVFDCDGDAVSLYFTFGTAVASGAPKDRLTPLYAHPNPNFDEVLDLLALVADNLNDMPISDEWAAKTAKRAIEMLGRFGYSAASPKPCADEIDALRKDAARYRWLKAQSAFPAIYIEVNGELHDDRTLDAAIDAAMKEKP